jgi:pilus assembly protein CpaC
MGSKTAGRRREEMSSRFGPSAGKTKLFVATFALVLGFYTGCWGAGVEIVSGKGRKINLEAGKSIIIRSEAPISGVASGDEKVATVRLVSSKQAYVTGAASGVTNITLWQGEDKVAAAYNVEVAPDVSRVKEKIQHLFPEEKGLRISATNDSLTLAGSVSGTAVLTQVLAMAEAYAGEKKVINAVQVSGGHQVMLEVRVAEMQRSLTKNLTIDLMGMGKNGTIFTSLLGNLGSISAFTGAPNSSALTLNFAPNTNALFHIAGGNVSVSGFLQALKDDGLAKVLAEPTLMAVSGQTATFLAGGEYPVPIPQGLGAVAIEYKPYGVALSFTPTVLDDNRISMKVAPEVSELDPSTAVVIAGVTVPGLTKRSVSTVIELGDGQSFAIAGLLSDNIKESIGKYPYLGDVPVLGALFRSSQFQRNETELIVLVTPHLVKPLDVRNQPLPTDRYVEPSDTDFFLRGLLQGCEKASPPPICQGGTTGLVGDFGHALPK